LEIDEIKNIFEKYWKKGWGSVAADEVVYIQELIKNHKPKKFLEIGMASGLSGGLISRALDEYEGEIFTTIDHDNTFFGDPSRENGFLIDKIYTGENIKIEKMPFKTSLDLSTLGRKFDMAFIDANHQHPWPIIDTLCLYPFMQGEKIVIHHDLKLFKNQDIVYGIGPKYLFDQFPESCRDRSSANNGNIFYVKLSISREQMEAIAIDAFSLPWSLRTPLNKKFIDAIRFIITNYYSSELLSVFDKSLLKFNKPYTAYQYTGQQENNNSLNPGWMQRLKRKIMV